MLYATDKQEVRVSQKPYYTTKHPGAVVLLEQVNNLLEL